MTFCAVYTLAYWMTIKFKSMSLYKRFFSLPPHHVTCYIFRLCCLFSYCELNCFSKLIGKEILDSKPWPGTGMHTILSPSSHPEGLVHSFSKGLITHLFSWDGVFHKGWSFLSFQTIGPYWASEWSGQPGLTAAFLLPVMAASYSPFFSLWIYPVYQSGEHFYLFFCSKGLALVPFGRASFGKLAPLPFTVVVLACLSQLSVLNWWNWEVPQTLSFWAW